MTMPGVRMFLLQPTCSWRRGASGLYTLPWGIFLVFLRENQQVPHLHGLHVDPTVLDPTSWFQVPGNQGKCYFLHFFPQAAPGHFWVQDPGTIIPLVWPATAGFHLNHQVNACKGFYFLFVEFYVLAIGGEQGSVNSCLSHPWVSLGW